MTYTINANAKNVWIRDNADTMDLSPITDASSVYLTNGRSVEQELGEGSMVSNIVTMDKSMEKVVEGAYDGAYESCVFRGKSLVNLAQFEKLFEVTPSFLNTQSVIWYGNTSKHYVSLSMFKPNTKYIVKIGSETPSRFRGIYISGLNMPNPNGYYTEHNGVFTTPSTIPTEANMYIKGVTGETITKAEYSKCQILILEYQEGMENWDTPYFTGLCDVKMPILRNVGKNLIGNLVYGNVSSQGIILDNMGQKRVRTDYIPISSTGAYRISNHSDEIGNIIIFTFDENKNLTRNRGWNTSHFNSQHTFSNEEKYIIIEMAYDLSNQIDIDLSKIKIQFEQNIQVTTYEPYKTNILRTSEEIVLREVGGVCDTYNVLTGEYTQRIGEGQFCGDGLTAYAENETYSGAYYLHSNSMSDSPLLSPTMKNLTVTEWKSMSCEGIYKGSSGIGVVVNTSKLSQSNLTGLKAYFTQNPVTFQYQLAEPITTIVKPSTIPFAYENGHIILESGSEGQSLLPTLEYSTVVNRTGQVESVAKTIQTQEKQLTMLEQMLVQNIIGLDYNNTVLALNLEINEVM